MTSQLSVGLAHDTPSNMSQTPVDTAQPLRASLEALGGRVKAGLSTLKAVNKAVTELLKKPGLADLRALEGHIKSLSKARLDELDLVPERDALVEALRAHQERRRASLRLDLMGRLQRLATADGLELARVGDSPPVLLIAPITIALDFGAGRANLSYARELVHQCQLAAEAILAGRRDAMQDIRRHAVDSEAFFDLLRRAYEMVLAASGSSFGERVELVDLLTPLALLRCGVDRWRTLGLAKTPPYERYQLAYQLQRLRRDGLLERDGLRLDLGTATGGTTRQKRNVLFVPQAGGEGQYYLSLRLMKSR